VREKSREMEKMGGGEGGEEYDSFAVLLYPRLRRGSGSLGRGKLDGRSEAEHVQQLARTQK